MLKDKKSEKKYFKSSSKKMKCRLRLLFLVFAISNFLSIAFFAKAQMSISPIIIRERAHPGGLARFFVSIANTGKAPLSCEMGTSAMEVVGAGLPVEVKEAPRSCKNWINFRPERFTLNPGENKRVLCELRVPRDAEGGYYAIIYCQGTPVESGESGREGSGIKAGIHLSYRMIAPLLLTVPGPNLQAVIEVGKPFIEKKEEEQGYILKVPVRNQGNIHARLEGFVKLKSSFGQSIENIPLTSGRGFVLPRHERLFNTEIEINLSDGMYVAEVNLIVEDSSRPIRGIFPFYVNEGIPKVGEPTEDLLAQLKRKSPGFIVTPLSIELQIPPGGRRSKAVEIKNLTDESLQISCQIKEWYRSPQGEDLIVGEIPPHKRSAANMLLISKENFKVLPRSKRRIPVTVALPRNARGEYYAALVFDCSEVELENNPEALLRRGILIRVSSMEKSQQSLIIEKFTVRRQATGALLFGLKCRNTGEVGVSPEIKVSIRDSNGKEAGKIYPRMPNEFIQAGTERLIQFEWRQIIDPGHYTAELTLRFDPEKPPITKRAEFDILES